jgi:hypothetical protein
MNSPTASAVLNHQLTAFATGFMNDVSKGMELAERLCPVVRVPGSNGQYKTFDDENSFLIYDTGRAAGGDPNTILFSAGDAYYNCTEQALQVKVDIAERRAAGDLSNAVAQQMLDEGKLQALINAQVLSGAHKRVSFVLDNLTAESGLGEFSNPDIDPIEQIDELVDTVLGRCSGREEFLKITMDRTAWRKIRNHPKVKARCNGVQVTGITRQQFVDALASPIDLGVYSISYKAQSTSVATPAKPGNTGTAKRRLLAGEIILHYSIPNATVYDPSAFKCFMPVSVGTVKSYSANHGLWDGHFMDWAETIKKTSALAAARITLS